MKPQKFRRGMNNSQRKDIARSPMQAKKENNAHNVIKVDIGELANSARDTIIQVIDAITNQKRRKPRKKLIKPKK